MAVLAATASLTTAAHAQGDDPRAIAEALFRSGRELMARGDLANACSKFTESNRIDSKPGTLMNLALCHERIGRTASAWSEYVQAAEMARSAGQVERERVANERAHGLEAALAHLVIDADAVPYAVVALDDRPIGPGAFRTAIPVDPGDHVVRATAAGKEPFTQTVAVPATAELVTVHIPALSTTGSTFAPTPPRSEVRLRRTPSEDGSSSARVWGYGVGSAGLVMLGIGGYFGIRAFSERQIADDQCTAMRCSRPGLNAIGSMKTAEAISTISTAAGIATVGVGLYLVLAPTHGAVHHSTGAASPRTLRIGPDAALRGVRVVWNW
jgi:hypothetical protein